MKKDENVIKQGPCVVCGKPNPAPYARVRGTDVVCSKKCNTEWENRSFDERHPKGGTP